MTPIKTISDLAALAGVSKSTVSRALNDNPVISKKTRKRIQTLAAKHQFEAHQGARRLSINSSQTIALIYPESQYHSHMVTDPYFVEVLRGITSTVGHYGYDLIISQPADDMSNVINQYLVSKRADGVIYLGNCQSDILPDFGEAKSPVIICGADNTDKVCCVDCDNVEGGRLAAKHFLGCGCQKIAFIGGPPEKTETKQRFNGFMNVLQNSGLLVDGELIVYGNYLSGSGYQQMKKLLHSNAKIDGVFICNDLMAMGALEAIREEGLITGKDISVIGFDDIPFAQFSSPPLTTISQNIIKVGETLVHKLMQYLEDQIITKSILPVELVIRKTTKF